MFRRKTRNSTAYTGVGLASPSAQAPDNTAMAAALTIGQNLKQTRPEVYGKPQGTSSMTRQGPPKPSGSLLKRSSSIQGSMSSQAAPRQSRAGSGLSNRHSMAPPSSRQVYNIDDSFNDSFFEEVGHETDAHYSNEAQLRDLKLHHRPQTAPPKMVKKYIPTPNGITVVEVPEESMKQEIARSNSMRSGLSISRAGSMRGNARTHSMTNAARGKKQNRSRLSSLVSAPRIDEQSEVNYQSAQSSRVTSHHSMEAEALHRQIEHEKQVARDLERQRAEYEQLKQLRLENERKLRELQVLQEEDSASFEDSSSLEEKPVMNGEGVKNEQPHISAHDQTDLAGDEEEDVPVAPLPFVVDELDSKNITGSSEQNGHTIEESTSTHADSESEFAPISTSPHEALVNSYGDTFVPLSELEKSEKPMDSTDNFGIEEVPAESFESPNLASQLRPNFARQESGESHVANNISYEFGAFPEDNEKIEGAPMFAPVPEIIGVQDTGASEIDPTPTFGDKGLVPPPNFAGSIRSISSVDSKSRPMKSAMKNAKPAYSSNNSSSESPAHQAYLSLTTAENTRLNSKLSSSQLAEPSISPESRPQPPKSPNNQKRMSQSLRKQPSAASQSGLAGRSLRPQSMMDNQPGKPHGGMSGRTLKPQPIAPHPVSKPNYQSPSKLRAAELYAKANSRPISEFRQAPRKSSFSRDAELPEKPTSDIPKRSSHRTTLRSPQPVAQSHASVARPPQATTQQTGGGKFTSKFADSDDEGDKHAGGTGNGGFSSRFIDSDDEAPRAPAQTQSASSPMKSLRKKEEKTSKEENAGKEKKPKKKFLKKLFGRN
ncbi:hypothetical protein OXX69_007490 [Metschnikowia pulcherrima]